MVPDSCAMWQNIDTCENSKGCTWLHDENPKCAVIPTREFCEKIKDPTIGKCWAVGCYFNKTTKECEGYYTETYCNAITVQGACKNKCTWTPSQCINEKDASCSTYTAFDDCIGDSTNNCRWTPHCYLA